MSKSATELLESSLKTTRKALWAVGGFSLAVNLLMLASPIYMLQVYDRVLTSRSTDTLMFLSLIIGLAILTMAILEGVRSSVMIRMSTWLDNQLAGTVLTGSIASTLKQGADPSIQGLRDLATVRSFLTGPSIFPILDAPWAPIYLAFVFMLHPLLGWTALAGAVVLFSLALVNQWATSQLLAASSGANMKAMRQAEAAVRNADAIEAMGLMPNLIQRWGGTNEEGLALQSRASQRSGVVTAFSKFVRLALQTAMLGTGAWLAILGEVTPGAMIAGSILMGRALSPVEQAISSWRSATSAKQSYGRIKQQLAIQPGRSESMPLPPPKGKLDVEGVSYVHPGMEAPVLRNVSFAVEPGEGVGLIGPSGSGKTTLGRLLLGNIAPRAGTVRLDGMDVSQWDPENLGEHVGYLPQDVELFAGTIKENISRMGEGDPDAVVEAARLAGVHELVLRFPAGYETEVGDGGMSLSGGERQRVALARALYGNPQFIVLDEPNASLDSEGEQSLLKALELLKQRGATFVVIAHRPSVLRYVDKVVILKEGMVTAFGPRDEVLEQLNSKAAPNAPATAEPSPAETPAAPRSPAARSSAVVPAPATTKLPRYV